jgi:hypothetical protein
MRRAILAKQLQFCDVSQTLAGERQIEEVDSLQV